MPKKKRRRKRAPEPAVREGISVGTMTLWLAIVVALLGWGFAAGLYASGYEAPVLPGRIRGRGAAAAGGIMLLVQGVATFVYNAFAQIPNFFAVVGDTFRNRLWFVIVFVLLEAAVLLGGWQIGRLERHMEEQQRRRDQL